MGYALQNFTLPNPIDMLLVQSQKVFPLDYVIILGITWLLVMCTLSGIRNLGIRLFLVKVSSSLYDHFVNKSRLP